MQAKSSYTKRRAHMRYGGGPKRNLSSAGTNADSCIYVILLLGKPNLDRNEHQEQGYEQILLRRSLSLEKRAVGRDAVVHGSGYLPPAEFSLRLCTNQTAQSPSCGRPKFTFTISTWLERSKSEGAM